MSDQTDQQAIEPEQGQEQAPETGGTQFDALQSHMEQMSAKLDQLMPSQQQQGPTFGQITDPAFDPYADGQMPSYEEPDYGQYQQSYEQQYGPGRVGDPAYQGRVGYDDQTGYPGQYQPPGQVDPGQALQWIQDQISEGVQAQMGPFMAQQRAREIEAQYPDLSKPETIQQIAPVAQQLAASMNLGPDGWRNPDFLLMVYQAQQAQTNASQQIAAEDQQPGQAFEGGGAGVPDAGEPNLAERILAAYPHGSAAQFWGA